MAQGEAVLTDLNGKAALITGASSGIGHATALAMAKEGIAVALAARRRDRLEILAAKITADGGRAFVVEADISDHRQATYAVSETHKAFGRFDILVNNAGVMLMGRVHGADIADWRRMIDVNLMGLLYCTHAALDLMVPKQSGHIINISSIAGRIPLPLFAVYNASKFAVNGFTEALRQEVVKQDVRITTIEPGIVSTELTGTITDPEVSAMLTQAFEGVTSLEADDIARAVVYALSQPGHVAVNEIMVRPTRQQV